MAITNGMTTAVALRKYARALDRHTVAMEKLASALEKQTATIEKQRDSVANLFESLDDLNAGMQLVLARAINNLAFKPTKK